MNKGNLISKIKYFSQFVKDRNGVKKYMIKTEDVIMFLDQYEKAKNNESLHLVSKCVGCGANTRKPTLTYCDNCLQQDDYS